MTPSPETRAKVGAAVRKALADPERREKIGRNRWPHRYAMTPQELADYDVLLRHTKMRKDEALVIVGRADLVTETKT